MSQLCFLFISVFFSLEFAAEGQPAISAGTTFYPMSTTVGMATTKAHPAAPAPSPLPPHPDNSCLLKLAHSSKFRSSVLKCYKSLRIDESKIPSTEDEMKEKDYDDDCLSNCVLDKMDFLRDDNQVDVDEILKEYHAIVPNQGKAAVVNIVNKCNDETEKFEESEGAMALLHPCKFSARFLFCLSEMEDNVKAC